MKKLTEAQLRTTEPYSIILSKLRHGAKKAIPVKELCEATGLPDRVLRKNVEIMRECGVCIVSDKNGYYLPATEDELTRFISRTEKTARSYFASLRTAKRTLRKLQTEMQLKLPI